MGNSKHSWNCREYARPGEVWVIQNTGESVENTQIRPGEVWVIQNTMKCREYATLDLF
jgi:hypothetical protein